MANLELVNRVGPGRPRVRPGRAKSDGLALDPTRAGPDRQNSGLTLALLGSGRVGPRANRAWPCPWTVYRQSWDQSSSSDEPRRMQVLDLYCLTRFESESSSRGLSIKD
jgi:hypothetical protein